jgi:hypothetical protein
MRRKMMYIFETVVLFILFFSGCREEYLSQNGVLQENYATFCILDNRLKNQFVRINRIYFSENDKRMPNSTKVILTEINGKSYTLRDTVIDKYPNESMYYLPTIIARGKTYELKINSPDLPTQTASVYVFKKPTLNVSRLRWMTPLGLKYKFMMNVVKERTPIFLFTSFIEYEIGGSNGKLIEHEEIPLELFYKVDLVFPDLKLLPLSHWSPDTIGREYPTLSPYENKYYNTKQDDISFTYDGECIKYALKLIQLSRGDYIAIVRRGITIIYVIDNSLYEKFLAQKMDRYSIRLDESMIPTNFTSSKGDGMGYFGCVMADTISFDVYEEMISEFKLLDGQE